MNTMLRGRTDERAVVDRLLAAAGEGRSGALVVRGEAGIGKSALLDHAARSATTMRVLRGAGVESEAELPFAGLHQLFSGFLGRGESPESKLLPGADRFALGLAVLTLLADLAETSPVLCLIDDAHWLDHTSADALLFAARRLEAEGVVLLFAARDLHAPAFPTPGIPELRLTRLEDTEAAEVLADHAADLPAHVRAQILAQAQGNPLALMELPVAQREGSLVTHPYQVAALPAYSRIQQTFADRIGTLPARTRTLLLVAAADTSGEVAIVLAAAARLSCTIADVEPAESRRLARFSADRIEFRHPLIRAAVYQNATLGERLAVHRALAGVFADHDPARHAWHLASATTAPDEAVAEALERGAEAARALGGHGAVVAAYQRAAELSPDQADRGRRLVTAAEAAVHSGQLQRAAVLADRAAAHPLEPAALGQVAMIRASLADDRNRPLESYGILLDAAGPVARGARDTATCLLFSAVESAWMASDFAAVDAAADQARSLGLPGAEQVRALARTAVGLSRLTEDADIADGMAAVRELLGDFGEPDGLLPTLRGGAAVAAWRLLLGEHRTAHELALELERDCRVLGAAGVLPHALAILAQTHLYLGHPRDAEAAATEGRRIAEDIGQHQNAGNLRIVLAQLAALRGDREDCLRLTTEVTEQGDTPSSVRARIVLSRLDLSQGRHEEALNRLVEVAERPNLLETLDCFPDLVEAAARLDRREAAAGPLEWFRRWAEATGQPWACATALRCTALSVPNAEAEPHFTAAVELHAQGAPRPFERARTELLYGEWLRRARRPADARPHLRSAVNAFDLLGALPWAERARTELRATGESRQTGAVTDRLAALTPQELTVIRLAATGLSNREIAAQLFVSPRTVGYHLYKAYPKLGVSARSELIRLDLGGGNATAFPP